MSAERNFTTWDMISTWDWIEIGYSFVAGFVGIPLNLYIFTRLIRQVIARKHTRLTLLSLQINVSDIMILVVKCVAYSVWMIVQQWYAGDVCCRIFQFFVLFPFYLSSNCRVAVALDLFQSIHFPMSIRVTANRYARIYIVLSWLVAIASAAPQMYYFQADEVPIPYFDHFTQCFNYLLLNQTANQAHLRRYEMYHVLIVFWVPLAIIIGLYCSITVEGFRALNRQIGMKMGREKNSSNVDTPGKTGFAQACLQRCCCSPADDSIATRKDRSENVITPLLVQQSAKMVDVNAVQDKGDLDVNQKLAMELDRRYKAEAMEHQAMARARAQKLKILRFSLFIILAYLLCWLPYQIKTLVELLWPEVAEVSDRYFHWLSAVMILNSCLNPFLYGFGQTAAGQRRANTDSTMCVSAI